MATIYAPRAQSGFSSFYVTMAAIFALVAFAGFAPSYWLRLPSGTFAGSPMLHFHGLLFSLWTLYFLFQAVLVANGKLRSHKSWGLAGVSLATAMVLTGLTVAINGLSRRIELGFGDQARAFAVVPVSSALLFGGLIIFALVNLRRPEWHKRLMLVATASILQPAIARFIFLARGNNDAAVRLAGPPPSVEFTMIGAAIADLFIVAALVYDWRARGRPHPAYLWGLGAVLAVHLSRPFISRTETWLALTDFLIRFNG